MPRPKKPMSNVISNMKLLLPLESGREFSVDLLAYKLNDSQEFHIKLSIDKQHGIDSSGSFIVRIKDSLLEAGISNSDYRESIHAAAVSTLIQMYGELGTEPRIYTKLLSKYYELTGEMHPYEQNQNKEYRKKK